MSLHILGGKLKGRKLKKLKSSKTRPTTSLIRKAVFDMLQKKIEGASFLDLFAGSGAIGFEALSRGAHHVTFVEANRNALVCIKQNISLFHFEKESTIFFLDVFDALNKIKKKQQQFQIIYVDPPYEERSIYQKLLLFLDTSSLLSKEGLLFFETPNSTPFITQKLNHLIFIDERRFGASLLRRYTTLTGSLIPK